MKKKIQGSGQGITKEAQRMLAFVEGSATAEKNLYTSLVFAPKDIRYIRTELLKLSQSAFARLLKKETLTVASWESGRRVPDQTTTMLIYLLSKHEQLRGWMEHASVSAHAKVTA